nr:immunoglobulin heavy chain junction region [Mus musculus]MBK4183907.1 immunoglobulin heavy chain junction region [Mus musculus]
CARRGYGSTSGFAYW